jgi:hypothetical protein
MSSLAIHHLQPSSPVDFCTIAQRANHQGVFSFGLLMKSLLFGFIMVRFFDVF